MNHRPGRVEALAVTLCEDVGRVVARGVVSIDDSEGAPPAIFWEGELYLKSGPALYVKTRAMFAGASFQAVP